MGNKSEKIEALVAKYQCFGWRANYLEFFDCFNQQEYFAAHDVLEELWLKDGKFGPNFSFYKGLIQCAGAFVHLQKHYREPFHRVHSQRLRPAYRLLQSCLYNLQFYPSLYEYLDLHTVRTLCKSYGQYLQRNNFHQNPWKPITAPQLHLSFKNIPILS